MSKCARKLAPRWGALITFIYLLGLWLTRLIHGAMPATNVVQWGVNTDSFELPVMVPRLADTAVVFVAGTVLAWLLFDLGEIGPSKAFGFKKPNALWDALGVCSLLGVIGFFFAVWGGLVWATFGAFFAAVIMSWWYLLNFWRKIYKPRMWEEYLNQQLVLAHWWGGLVMFALLTPFTGLAPATAYVLYTLAVVIGLELVPAVVVGGGILIDKMMRGPFRRTFLVCDVDGDCQETAVVKA